MQGANQFAIDGVLRQKTADIFVRDTILSKSFGKCVIKENGGDTIAISKTVRGILENAPPPQIFTIHATQDLAAEILLFVQVNKLSTCIFRQFASA